MHKLPVAVLGATGAVGQRLVALLDGHPWFEAAYLGASERSAGRPYGEAARWLLEAPMPASAAAMAVGPVDPAGAGLLSGGRLPSLVFSALDAPVARGIEPAWAAAGALVVSNASAHRMLGEVPLVVPEVNAGHLELLRRRAGRGAIVTNPNCSTIGLVMALKPLVDAFGLEACLAITMQAASGAGYPGVPSLDLIDNVVPYIAGEEEKLETEPRKILGALQPGAEAVREFDLALSASCHRVAVRDGHLMSVSVSFREAVTRDEILAAWEGFRGPPSVRALPSAPERPLVYRPEPDRPQPRLDRAAGNGMGVSLGRLRPCPILGWKFELLSHNTVRGAAGGTLLLAELCAREGFVPGFARLDAGT